MAGGPSTGNPLTEYECAASLKFAATNRLIDFPLANIINSGMKRAFVLTQFNSYTLNQHVHAAYPPEVFGFGSDGYVHTHHDLRQRPPPPSDLANLTDPFDATFRKFNVLFVLFEGDGIFF